MLLEQKGVLAAGTFDTAAICCSAELR